MAKLGMKNKSDREKLQKNKSATVNKAGGLAFSFEDPAEFLLGTIGSAMFVEPKYYKDTENLEQLKKGNFSTDGLDEQAVRIINACIEVARGENPRDLLALAHWARKELKMRTTPQVMVAVAAKFERTKPFVRKYVPLVSTRADDVKQVVAAYEHLYGWKGFPACLKKGVSDRLSALSEYEILKYNTKNHPTFADLLRFCERRKDYPFSKAMREYILRGEVIDSEATPVLAARKELTSRKRWSKGIPELAKKAGATWEVLISQFGNKPEVWEAVIPLMGYMALLRNIGNFLTADIPIEMVRLVAKRLADPEQVIKSKQLPFRFLSAYRTLYPENSNYYYGGATRGAIDRDRSAWNKRKTQLFLEAVETALDHSVLNVPELPGVTCIAADNSGSMSSPLSQKSVMTIRDAANALCAIVHKRCEESYVAAFGDRAVWPPLTKRNSVLTNMQQIATFKDSYRGHSTNAWTVFDHLIRHKICVDRIIVLSDMQCYDTVGFWGGGRSVAEYLKKYRREFNSNCYAHFFDLRGYGTRQTPSKNSLDNVVAGFSEKIFDQVLIHEGVETADGSAPLPSLAWIRENF